MSSVAASWGASVIVPIPRLTITPFIIFVKGTLNPLPQSPAAFNIIVDPIASGTPSAIPPATEYPHRTSSFTFTSTLVGTPKPPSKSKYVPLSSVIKSNPLVLYILSMAPKTLMSSALFKGLPSIENSSKEESILLS